jgi:phosphonoacetaldehyde hydrolase
MNQLNVFPPEAVVSIGDTVPDVESGLNAGVWTIGLAKTGNELGLTEAEVAALSPTELASKLKRAYEKLSQAGAHYVVDGIGDVPAVVAHLNTRLARGEKP